VITLPFEVGMLLFYEGKQFPADYAGDILAAEHGS
jgi:glucose/arabinose dehydrogenase